MSPLFFCNKNGIPCLESQGVSVSATACTFSFRNHPFVNANYQGLIVVKITQTFEAPTTAVPIQFTTLGTNATNTLKSVGGDVTTASFNKPGIYLCFYDRTSNTLELLSRTA